MIKAYTMLTIKIKNRNRKNSCNKVNLLIVNYERENTNISQNTTAF